MASFRISNNPDHEKTLAKGSITFALNLYNGVCKETGAEKNLFMSPIFFMSALIMIFVHAKGNTAHQIKQTLNLTDLSDEDLCNTFKNLYSTFSGSKKMNYILKTENLLFVKSGHCIQEEILNNTEKVSTLSVTPANIIDDLISKGFKDLIPKLVLFNRAHFNWINSFNSKRTRKEKFYINNQKTVEVDMMVQEEDLAWGINKELGLQVVELPFIDHVLSMFIFIHLHTMTELADLEAKLTPEILKKLMRTMPKSPIKLFLPQFNLNHQFSAGGILTALGMTDIFSSETADLSDITHAQKNLHLIKVIHTASIEVKAERYKTAAKCWFSSNAVPTMNVNHPFLFLIRDNRCGSILFMGRVYNPNT